MPDLPHNANSLRYAADAVERAGNREFAAQLRRQAEELGQGTVFISEETQQRIEDLTRRNNRTSEN